MSDRDTYIALILELYPKQLVLDASEVAVLLGRSLVAVRGLRDRGAADLPWINLGRNRVITVISLADYLADRAAIAATPPPPPPELRAPLPARPRGRPRAKVQPEMSGISQAHAAQVAQLKAPRRPSMYAAINELNRALCVKPDEFLRDVAASLLHDLVDDEAGWDVCEGLLGDPRLPALLRATAGARPETWAALSGLRHATPATWAAVRVFARPVKIPPVPVAKRGVLDVE